MRFLSILKATILRSADALNATVGGPQPFTRQASPDPSGHFTDDMTRRDYIAAQAETELAGFVRDGVFVAQKPNDIGDACIWQGVYTAMTAMRWHVKPNAENQAAMRVAAAALARYFYPTGAGESILLRGAMPLTLERDLFQIDQNNKSQYFMDGYLGPAYVFRQDASLDSLLGAMFGAAIVGRFGDATSRAVLADPLARFARGFARAGFKITNRDGSQTTHGDCSPGFAQAPVRILAAALPSLVAGGTDWRAIAAKYAPEFATTDTQIPGKISYVNAHLAILASLTYAAATTPTVPGHLEVRAGLGRLLSKYADAGNAFLVFATARLALTPSVSERDKAAKVLIEFPLGAKPAAGLNSSVAPALQPVPVWQRPPSDVIWQRSPYQNSGSESASYTRLDYLVAHYFQRSL